MPSVHVHACNENCITEFAKFLQLKSKLQEKKNNSCYQSKKELTSTTSYIALAFGTVRFFRLFGSKGLGYVPVFRKFSSVRLFWYSVQVTKLEAG